MIKKKCSILNITAAVLLIVSCILYGLIAVVPFLTLPAAGKAAIIPVLIIAGEVTWWAGVAIIGKQAVTKFKKYLNPFNWIPCKKN